MHCGRKPPPWDATRWTRAPAARGEKVVRFRHHRASEAETQTWVCRSQRPRVGAANLAATLRGRPLRSDGLLVRCRVLAPRRLDTCCTWRTMQMRTCSTLYLWVGWHSSPKKRASAVHVCFRIEPAARTPLAGDMSAVCPRFPRFGGAGGCWGLLGGTRLLFHGSRRKIKAEGRKLERRAGGELWGNWGTWRQSRSLCQYLGMLCVSVCLLPLPQCLCYCRILQDLLFELPRLGTY